MAAILRDLEQLGRYSALHSNTIQGMCLQNIIRISVKMKVLDLGKRFEHTFYSSGSLNTIKRVQWPSGLRR